MRRESGLSNQELRAMLFDLYVNNLNAMRKHPGVEVTPHDTDVFVCPLCFRCFTRDALDAQLLSLDHIPPESLGGKRGDATLVCVECNRSAGSELESKLVTALRVGDVWSMTPGATIDTQYSPFPDDDTRWLAAKLQSSSDGFSIIGDPKRTDPELIDMVSDPDFVSSIKSFRVRLPNPDMRLTSIALLKTAYLFLFRVYGYWAISPRPMNKIREQIHNSKDPLLPDTWIASWMTSEIKPGIHFVFWHNGIHAYLVAFNVDTGKRTKQYKVVLPAPDDSGLRIYEQLKSIYTSPTCIVEVEHQKDPIKDLEHYSLLDRI